jgi:hypothetical protein
MKKAILLTVLLALSLSTGCKKQLYQFVGTVPITQEYLPDQATGSFSGTDIITKEDVTDVLNLPNDAQVNGVDLQNTGATVEPLAGNAATQVLLSGTVTVGSGTPVPLFNNFPVPTNSTFTLAAMNLSGVQALTNQINAYLAPMPSSTPITIALSGISVPAGSRMHVKITLKMQLNVPSEACIEFPSFISEGGKCETP